MLDVVVWPHPILKQKMKPVEVFDKRLKLLANQMFETMYEHKGLGLAAPQVGIDKQMLVMDVTDCKCSEYPCEHANPLVMINPTFGVHHDDKDLREKGEEGCLSFPGFLVDVERWTKGTVWYASLEGEQVVRKVDGLEARCAQHEIDHLDGVTFLRYLSKHHRDLIQSKMRKRGGR